MLKDSERLVNPGTSLMCPDLASVDVCTQSSAYVLIFLTHSLSVTDSLPALMLALCLWAPESCCTTPVTQCPARGLRTTPAAWDSSDEQPTGKPVSQTPPPVCLISFRHIDSHQHAWQQAHHTWCEYTGPIDFQTNTHYTIAYKREN